MDVVVGGIVLLIGTALICGILSGQSFDDTDSSSGDYTDNGR